MVIQPATMTSAVTATSSSSFKRKTDAPVTEKSTDTSTISQATQDRLAFEKAFNLQIPDELFELLQESSVFTFEKPNKPGTPFVSPYRVEGPVHTLEEIAKSTGVSPIAYKMPEDLVSELKLREQQEMAREIVNFNYAKAHKYQPVGQVLVDGKVFATVLDSDSFEMAHSLPGLSEAQLSPADRLAEIARAVNGEIITSDLMPTLAWAGPGAPESMLPPLTARSYAEIFNQEIAPEMEKLRLAWEEQTGEKIHAPHKTDGDRAIASHAA